MLLNEVLNTKPHLNVVANEKDRFVVDFTFNQQSYTFIAKPLAAGTELSQAVTHRHQDAPTWGIVFGMKTDGNIETDVTNAGNQFAVLSAVKQCVQMLIQKTGAKKIAFKPNHRALRNIAMNVMDSMSSNGWFYKTQGDSFVLYNDMERANREQQRQQRKQWDDEDEFVGNPDDEDDVANWRYAQRQRNMSRRNDAE